MLSTRFAVSLRKALAGRHEGHEDDEGHESNAVAVNVQRLCVKRVKSAPLLSALSHHSVFLAGSGALQTRARMRQFLFTAMAFATCGLSGSLTDDVPSLRASAFVSEAKDVSPNRKGSPGEGQSATSLAIDKVFGLTGTARTVRLQVLCIILLCCAVFPMVCFMYQPQQGGANSLRLPPRWDPSMEGSLPFRNWMQDLMLWTICTDLNPAQQCAAITSQLGGAARDLARTLTPIEVYQGGIINGQQLDPVSFLLHGLQVRFAPLDEENRLRAAQDLLSFSRRSGESVDTLISRFEITRQRARDEGGGAISLETASLLLLRACGVSAEQFQSLTQPFGYRLPTTELEFTQLGHHLRRMGHIVERFPNNIASGLRQSAHYSQAFVAEADTGSSTGEQWQEAPAEASSLWDAFHSATAGAADDWAYTAMSRDPAASDTESATSSDNDEALPMEDLSGMAPAEVDEYLFGQYQHAKKRWRRFTGKPVRALRRTLRKKGKGKGKGKRSSFLNIGEALQQSAYFRAKGKGGKSSGKGFGRKVNPTGRDGEPLRCSVCGSSYHLRARCPRRTDTPATAAAASSQPQSSGPSFPVQSSGLHFAAFESDGSWANVLTPRSTVSAAASRVGSTVDPPEPEPARNLRPSAPPSVHHMSPDPWQTEQDPWMQWYQDGPSNAQPSAQQAVQSEPRSTWTIPGIGNVGVSQSFSEVLGFIGREPPSLPAEFRREPTPQAPPAWFSSAQQGIAQAQQMQGQRRHSDSGAWSTPQQMPSVFSRQVSAPVQSTVTNNPMLSSVSVTQSASASTTLLAVPPASVNIFSQVHALRQASAQTTSAASRAVAQTIPESPAQQSYTGHVATCTLCLSQFEPGDHVARLECGHVFHCLCLGEMLLHSTVPESHEGVVVDCPNCRAHTQVRRSWHYPRFASEPSDSPPAADPAANVEPHGEPENQDHENAYITTPVGRDSSPEFMTPEAESSVFPWWPVPETPTDRSGDAGSSSTSEQPVAAYHSNVRLPDGRVGLLVDPGSYGNLVGELWLRESSAHIARAPQIVPRASPLQVGGVGKGAQVCQNDCKLPIAISRLDGSAATGSFTSPIVQQSGCPALLGLRALTENRAILDLGTKQLHFLGEGQPILKLPPGSETFQLESALSGHLLLPCSEFDKVSPQAVQGEHHLFTDNSHHGETSDARAPSQQDSQPVSSDQVHLSELSSENASSEEQQCADVLAAFTYDDAAALLVKIASSWHASAASPERFKESRGLSLCLGMYMRGGMHGLTNATRARPQLARMLATMLRVKCPHSTFTSLMLNVNVQAPVHVDKYNCGQNIVLPVHMPRHGGDLWVELCQGDTVHHPIAVQSHGGQHIAGQVIKLHAGQPVLFSPKAKHCVEPWKSGNRITLAAYSIGSHYKVDQEQRDALHALEFPLPNPADVSGHQAAAAMCVAPSQDSQPVSSDQVLVATAESQHVASATKHATGRPSHRSTGLGLLKKVLLVTIYHSTVSAFLNHGWQPVKMRPLELLRDGFDDSLSRIRRREFSALWVDFADARQFAGVERTTHVCNRLSTLISCADRHEVPVFLAASRRTAWRHTAIENLLQQQKYYTSHHAWCRASASLQPGVVSSVKLKVLSTIPLPNHDCCCRPGTEHVFDLDGSKGPGYARARAEAEAKAVGMIVAALESALEARLSRESAKPSDPICSSSTYVCASCGCLQTSSVCTICEEASCIAAPSQGNPVSGAHVASTAPRVFQVNDLGSRALADTVEPQHEHHSFPTEQKLQQRLRRQEQQAQGIEPIVRRKKKVVEQHFDDCGDDLSSLNIPACEYLVACSSDSDNDACADEAAGWIRPQLSLAVVWSFLGSSCPDPPDLHPRAMLATSVEEMLLVLSNPAYQSYGIEIVEICGGCGPTSYFCIRRRLQSGQGFELITGTDLNGASVQQQIIEYLDHAKPLVVVMSPVCTPLKPAVSRCIGGNAPRDTNRAAVHPQEWERSMRNAAPLSAFCGKVAGHQLKQGRYYVVEQPYPSRMFFIEPWPAVRDDPRSFSVVFHQCMTGQRANGVFHKRPTELVSNALPILQKFSDLQCDESHRHTLAVPGQAETAMRWSYDMCQRLASGIESLITQLAKCNCGVLAAAAPNMTFAVTASFPSVGSGPGDEGEVAVSEPWRKCKGCLWRLNKHDPLHTRKRGECKHPDTESVVFTCPGCAAHKTRADPSHTYGPDCRHALTSPRTTVQRRPFGRKPAKSEPTAGLRASDLGQQVERQAEEASADDAPEPARGSTDPAPARAHRGPDLEPRERRTWSEADVQTPSPSDWTSFDVQASLRGLRHGTEAQRRQILRKLHLRWWHSSTDRMTRILRAAGLGKDILDLVPAIQDTCKVCRHWARPQHDAKATCRMVVGFNIEVEGDIMFCRHEGRQNAVLVLADRGVRWVATTVISDRQTATLLTALETCWIGIYGPMQILLFDGETGLDDDESTVFFQLKGITKRTSAPGQHTRIVDRKIQILRDAVHKLGTQLHEEGLPVPFPRIVAEATFAVNALSSLNGMSPYAAVIGRIPAILPSDDTVMSDNVPDDCSRHVFRVREIAVQAIAEGTARERMKRALHSKTQAAGAELEFKVGQSVDWHRPPAHKDASGWRGPGTVVDLSRLEHGRIGIRTNTDQVITCRLQDVRHSLTLWSEELSTYFGHPDFTSPAGSQASHAQHHVQLVVDALRTGTVLTLGQVRTASGKWVESAQTANHRTTYQACMFIAETIFCLRSVVAVRLCKAVRQLTSREEFSSSLCVYWMQEGSKHLSFLHADGSKLSAVDLLGQTWPDFRCIQFLCVPEEEEWATVQRWSVPAPTEAQEILPGSETQSQGSATRLSTIPEGSTETDSRSSESVSWTALCEVFGDSIKGCDREALEQAYAACASEDAPERPVVLSLPDLIRHANGTLAMDPEIPSWQEVCASQKDSEPSVTFNTTLAACDTETTSFSSP